MNYVFTLDSVFKSILLKTQKSHKILQQVYGQNQSLDNLLQLAEQSTMAGNMRKRKKGRERQKNRQTPL